MERLFAEHEVRYILDRDSPDEKLYNATASVYTVKSSNSAMFVTSDDAKKIYPIIDDE